MFTRNQRGALVPAIGTALFASRAVGLIALLALMASRCTERALRRAQ